MSSPGAIVGAAARAFAIAGSMIFGYAITGARSYPGAAYLGPNASPRAAARPFVPPGAATRPDAHPGVSFGGADFLARGEVKKRATTTEGHGEWKKLKFGPPVREKEHIVVDGFAPYVADEQIVAGDIGQHEEANEGAGGEGEQIGAGGVGQGEEASEEAGEGEQIGAGDAEDSEGASEDEASEGVSEDEEGSEGAGGESEQVGEGSCSDTATSSRKRRKDPMIKIMEDILHTLQAHFAVVNKFMLGEFTRESIKKVMDLVVDCGAAEGTTEHFMVTKLFVKAEYRAMFLNMTTKGRLGWLKRWCQQEGLLEA